MMKSRHWAGWMAGLIACAALILPAAGQDSKSQRNAEAAPTAAGEEVLSPSDVSPPAEPAAAHAQRRKDLVASLTIFVLAVFVGFEVISKVPPILHTPLMSGSNAISGITLVGAVLVAGYGITGSGFIGFLAVILAMINVAGGFLVTHRMLAMFKKKS